MQNQDFGVFVTSDLYLCNKSQLTHRDDADAGRTSDLQNKWFASVLKKNVLASGKKVLEGNITQLILKDVEYPTSDWLLSQVDRKYAFKLVDEKKVSSQRNVKI